MTGTDLPLFPFDIPLSTDYITEYAEYREKCPVPKVRLVTGGEAYLVMRYEDSRRVCADTEAFSREACMAPEAPVLMVGSKLPGVMLNLDGKEHTRLRRLVVKAFSTGAVARFRPRIQQIANEWIDRMIETGSPADLVSGFGVPFPTQVIFEIFGFPPEDVPQLMEWVPQILSYTRYTQEQAAAAFQAITDYSAQLVQRKRTHPGNDLTSALIQARHDDGDRLSEEELISLIWLHLGGGSESTSNMIPNAVLSFHRNRDQWELLRERPDLIPGAVNEMMRYVSIAQAGFERMATKDVELSEVSIPAGSVVIPILSSANFDSDAYTQPHRFDITRSESPHLGFGHGPHRCVGASLGLTELEVALATLLRRMPDLRPAVEEDQLPWDSGVAMRKMLCMPVTW